MMHRCPAVAVLSLLTLALCADDLRNDSLNLPADHDDRLALAAKEDNDGLATLAAAVWADAAATVSAQEVAALTAFSKRDAGYGGRLAIALACTQQRSDLIRNLAAQRGGRNFAAWTLAAWALFERKDDDHLDEMRISSDGPPRRKSGSARQAKFGTALAKSATPANAPNAKGKASGLVEFIPLLIELLNDRDEDTRIAAAIAIAYAGLDDPELMTALRSAAEKKGPIAAALLLLQARLGQALDPAAIREAFDDRRSQPKMIEGDLPVLSLDPLSTPGASMVCEAIGLAADKALLPILHEGLAHKDLRVRYDAARAIRRLADPASVPLLLDQIKKPKREDWPVLVQVCAALADIPEAQSIDPLIAALRTQEKPATRFRQDIIYALAAIAGNQFGRTNAAAWETWKSTQGADFAVDIAASQVFRTKYRVQDMSVDQLGGFYGLAIASDRLSFVLDYSNSMRGDPIANLKANATETINGFAKHVTFNLIAFNSAVIWLDDYQLSSDRKSALAFLENTALRNQTRSYDATEAAFGISDVDTLILLTDGQPTGGLLRQWPAIQPLTNLLLRYRPIAIHTIDFRVGGRGPVGKAKLDPLDQYASEHAGRYLIVE